MHYRQGSLHRRYVSDIDSLLKTQHGQVCSQDSEDAATKETERKKYEDGVFLSRDVVTAPRVRVKRWQDEKKTPRPE